jgi:hypothetical protein
MLPEGMVCPKQVFIITNVPRKIMIFPQLRRLKFDFIRRLLKFNRTWLTGRSKCSAFYGFDDEAPCIWRKKDEKFKMK